MPIHLPDQGFMLVPPLEFPAELIILRDVKNNIPLRKNVPGVNILIISLPGALRYESGGSSFSLSGGHLHQKES